MAITEAVVLTGASRGIGAALAQQLLSPTRALICVARSANPGLLARADELGASVEYLQHDLSDAAGTDDLARQLFERLAEEAVGSSAAGRRPWLRLILINNAGVVEPVGMASEFDLHKAAAAFQVNLFAAMSFTSRFLAATAQLDCDRRILNVSSGSGRKPIAGWSVYGASKAALDLYTRCVHEEQAPGQNPARVCSLAPGVVDTEMQATVRGVDPSHCPSVGRLRQMKESGALENPADTARRILAYLERSDFGSIQVDDVRNY